MGDAAITVALRLSGLSGFYSSKGDPVLWLSADHADDEEVVNPFNRTTNELTFDVGPDR
jgi:hypothetical protein